MLDGIDLKVPAGEFLAIVGPSGCGKSTLLNAILGFDSLSSGSVAMFGSALGRPDRRRICVFQQPTLFPYLTVLDNVTYGPWHVQRPWFHLLATARIPILGEGALRRKLPILKDEWALRKSYSERAMELLEFVGLGDAAAKYPHELSGGMRQRAQIAQALIMEPEILAMDEPFSALDEGTKSDLHHLVLKIHQTSILGRRAWLRRDGSRDGSLDGSRGSVEQKKMTILMVTHHLDEAIYLSSRLVALCRAPARIVLDIETPWFRYDEPPEAERYARLKQAIFGAVYDTKARGIPKDDEVARIQELAREARRGRESPRDSEGDRVEEGPLRRNG